ncbi:MAG TPA: hypothetical protein VK146_09230 [Tabrizicola sp.]|nr:hypothetical protein [Tabrizicola sp.]
MTQPTVAVLTGDLVRSTGQPAETVKAAMQAIRQAANAISLWQDPPQDTRFTRFRGDGWQVLLASASLSLRAATVIQARLIALGLESRISLGIGQADSLGSADLSDASGEVFELSGHGLDQMADSARLTIHGALVLEEDRMIAELLGERMGRWTAAQGEAAAMQLASPGRTPTLQEMGKTLGISAQAVNDRVRGAGCPAIASVLRRWEAAKRNQGWSGA